MLKTRFIALALMACAASPVMAEMSPQEYEIAKAHMDAKAGNFTHNMMDNVPGDDARRAELLSAVIAYQAVIASGSDSAFPNVAIAAQNHVADLQEWYPIIETTDGVMQMRPFWEQASDMFVSRLRLEEALAAATPTK